jgi:polysaccharide biosynthesis transport protein
MQDLLRKWRSEYDHVIIDSPPVISVTDAVLLSVETDAVLLVVRSGQTTTGALRRSRDLLLHVRANLLGLVVNAADLSSPDYYYYYGSKYRYYGDKKSNSKKTSVELESESAQEEDTPDTVRENESVDS